MNTPTGNNNNRTTTNDSNPQEALDSIESALDGIEEQLSQRPSLLRSVGSRNVQAAALVPGSSTSATAGRAVRESIRMALNSIRTRLAVVEAPSSPSPSSASSDETQQLQQQRRSTVRRLSERLATAEMAHSNRIPLNVLLDRRQSSAAPSTTTTTSTTASAVAAGRSRTVVVEGGAVVQKQSSHSSTVNDSSNTNINDSSAASASNTIRPRRSASVLLASRRLAEEAQGHAADMDLHGTSMHSLLTSDDNDIMEPMHGVEPIPEEKADEEMSSSDVDMDQDKLDENIDDKKKELPPILLTQTSYTKLDPARRSILFYQQHPSERRRMSTITQQSQSSSTVVYSWGSSTKASSSSVDVAVGGENTLHDDAQPRNVANALVSPTSRVGMRDIHSAAIGRHHTACCTLTGEVLVCGQNTVGQVDPDRSRHHRQDEGQEETTTSSSNFVVRPTLLESLSSMAARIVQVSCGANHTAALRSNGAVLTWGSNEYGQLGHRMPPMGGGGGTTAASSASSPWTFCRPKIMVLGPGRRATFVACGDGYTLVLTSRMGLLACGVPVMCGQSSDTQADKHDAAANDSSTFQRLAAPLPALEDLPLVSVAAGRRHAVALTAHGSAFAWGENTNGCLGREFPKATAVPVPIRVSRTRSQPSSVLSSLLSSSEPLSNWEFRDGTSAAADSHGGRHFSLADDIAVVDAACGDEHTVLVTRSGRLLVCGSNSRGQLGLDPASRSVLLKAEHLDHPKGRSFVNAEAGEMHSLLLDDTGCVWQCGGNESSNGPELVLEGKDIRWIAAGGNQNLAVAVAIGRTLPNPEYSDDGGDEVSFFTRGRSVEDLLSTLPEGERAADEEDEPMFVDETETELASRAEELLKTPAVLNSLFLDPTELEDLFQQLLSAQSPRLRQNIASAVERGIRRGLETVRSDDTRLMYPEQVRFLLLYIQCPLFVGWNESDVAFDQRGDLILLLCETILGLSYEGYKAFLSWATSIYPRELYTRFLVRPLIAQLAKGLSVEAGALRRPIPAVVAVLRWLYNASERAGNIALPEAFYCEAIGETDPRWLVEDLMMFRKADHKTRAANFFMCDNPFLFSPSIKRTLLMYESEMNMLRTAAQRLTYNEQERAYEFDPFYVLDVDREHLLTQTFQKIEKAEPNDLRKKLRVVFKGEDGVDAGGVTREFFQLLCAELFDVNSGMWSVSLDAEQITWFNSDCNWNDQGFYLVGVLLGLAVYNSVLLDVHFPQAVYRKLLGHSLGFEDLVDLEVKHGLQQLLDYEGDDVEDVFCLTFDVNWMDLGEEKRRQLKPGGSSIPVTSDNREEYVMLYVKWLLVDSINPQYDAFERGFLRVMEDSSLDLLRPEDLELLVVGSPELDFEALEKNTEYDGGYDSESEVIRHFWRYTKNADPETQLNLLRFTTGSAKAPIGGLGELSFKIQRAGPDSMQLPTSHTCFNTLLLPDYGDNYEKLEERLSRAILECEGFGLQ